MLTIQNLRVYSHVLKVLLMDFVLFCRQHSAQESSLWCSSGTSGSLETQLLLLEQQIKDVEGDTSTVQTKMKEVRSTWPDGWQCQYARLREKKEQLEEKLTQLLKEKLRNPSGDVTDAEGGAPADAHVVVQ